MPKPRSQTTTFNAPSASSTSRHHDTTSKHNASSDNEDVIPIPIQIFLWRQSKSVTLEKSIQGFQISSFFSPFIKQKFGTLTDASAIVSDRMNLLTHDDFLLNRVLIEYLFKINYMAFHQALVMQ